MIGKLEFYFGFNPKTIFHKYRNEIAEKSRQLLQCHGNLEALNSDHTSDLSAESECDSDEVSND